RIRVLHSPDSSSPPARAAFFLGNRKTPGAGEPALTRLTLVKECQRRGPLLSCHVRPRVHFRIPRRAAPVCAPAAGAHRAPATGTAANDHRRGSEAAGA